MLRLTPFKYIHVASVAEAIAASRSADNVALMGGGTDLLPNIKHRLANPTRVVGLRSISELQGISVEPDGWLRVGAAVTLQSIQDSDLVRDRYPALANAASLISTPQVQRQATIGGNICLDVRCNYYNQSEHWRQAVGYCMKKDSEICRVAPGGDRCWAVSSADTVPVLIAYDAELCIAGESGLRWQSVGGFYRDDGLVPFVLRAGEIVTAVRIPPPDVSVVYSKLRIRMSFDFPLVGAATAIALSPDGTVRKAKIVLTAVGSYPIEVTDAERVLLNNRLDEEVITEACDKVFRVARPMDNTEGAISHRKRMARTFVQQALREFSANPPPAS
jgi:4-hydroxybenzoyl-CoA reductase subunit beta